MPTMKPYLQRWLRRKAGPFIIYSQDEISEQIYQISEAMKQRDKAYDIYYRSESDKYKSQVDMADHALECAQKNLEFMLTKNAKAQK